MRHPASDTAETTAAGARARLELLFAERREARRAGLEGNDIYMRELLEDIDASRTTYIGLAVTEIASLRGELGGRLHG